MSLDIDLYRGEEEVAQMNWLRNPFGLCNWAEDNTAHVGYTPPQSNRRLWYVCNNWAYDESKNIDRKLFQEVVLNYKKVIDELKIGYFFFNRTSKQHLYCKEDPASLTMRPAPGDRYMISIETFAACTTTINLGDKVTLEAYKEWFGELVKFAELLQDESLTFYCSN